MTITSFATDPSAFRAQALDKPDEYGREPSRIEMFQAPGDGKIADAILVLMLMFMAVLWWM